jgi:sulfate adenylyltransferase subunit 2
MSDTASTQHKLHQKRRLAVKLRLDGLKLSDATKQSGLSAPTVIAAYRAYLAGGWDAVDARPRGRPDGDSLLSQAQQAKLRQLLITSRPEEINPDNRFWSYSLANEWLKQQGHEMSDRSAGSYFKRWNLYAEHPLEAIKQSTAEKTSHWISNDYPAIVDQARKAGTRLLWAGVSAADGYTLFHYHDGRKKFCWLCSPKSEKTTDACIEFFNRLLLDSRGQRLQIILVGIDITRISSIQQWLETHAARFTVIYPPANDSLSLPATSTNMPITKEPDTPTECDASTEPQTTPQPEVTMTHSEINQTRDSLESQPPGTTEALLSTHSRTHLQRLEDESIHIMREVVAEAENPVMMYSVGKDSAVMLHLALKAFYPAKPPFPLLHVDTTWKFRAMYDFRNRIVDELGFELITHINQEGVAQNVNPFTHGSALHTDIMKTEALKQALDKYQFDVAFGGARRDEEKSRAKERIFSFRSSQHRWEPKNQRPELWQLYNTRKLKGESIRVFPLSNWTELDIWQYIHLEGIPIVPLYYAAERPVVERDGALIMVDDDRMPLQPGEVPMMRKVRFRTLGCYPLTGAVESNANTLPEIIQEMLLARTSERQGRMIDHDSAASMEKKKQEGYF